VSTPSQVFYHQIAGGNLSRLSALNDGVFAIVLTLLILDVHAPVLDVVHAAAPLWAEGSLQAEGDLLAALGPMTPNLLAYLLSFLTLGMFWVGGQTLYNHLRCSDRHLTWIQLAFLLAVSVMPFSTALLADFMTYRVAVVGYWLNLLVLGLLLVASVRYAARAGLLDVEETPQMQAAFERRILIPQVLYAVAVLLCVVNTYLSVALLVLLQLNSAFAPNIRPLNRF
jgi:uncharacterized membrane protein